MKIIFMGTPSYATQILKALIEDDDIEVAALVTQPDKPVGRKQVLTPPHTKEFLQESRSKIPIYQPNSLKEEEAKEFLKGLKPDFIVVAAYGQILPKEILDIAPCINLHASVLPKYRGASPIQSAVKDQEEFTGVTAMAMDKGLDTGEILGISYVKIEKGMISDELFEKLSLTAAKLTIKTLKKFDKISPIAQIDALSSHSKKIKKSDGLLNLSSAKENFARFCAYYSWPGVFLESGLKIKQMKLSRESGEGEAGKIKSIKEQSVILSCVKGELEIFKVQPPSKKQMGVIDYIRGKRFGAGDYLS